MSGIISIYYMESAIAISIILLYIIYNNIVTDTITRYLTYISVYSIITINETTNMIHIYLIIEVISLISYILATNSRKEKSSITSGLEYFTVGSIASGIILIGITIIYGITGTMDIKESIMLSNSVGYKIGIIVLITGIIYKLGAFPFQTWMIDIYTKSPTIVTMYYSVFPKYALISVLMQINMIVDISVIGIVSIIIGSIGALYEKNVKAIMAYSSLTNIGYFIVLVNMNKEIMTYTYLIGYSIVVIGIFTIMIVINKSIIDIIDINRIENKYMKLAIVILTWALSGLPPTTIFITKMILIIETIKTPITMSVIIIASIISTCYYIRISIVSNYKYIEKEKAILVNTSIAITTVIAATTIATMSIGMII